MDSCWAGSRWALSARFPPWPDSYQVQPGDTLSSIAERYGTTQGVLRALNPAIDSADLLYIGQEIDLPDNAVPVPITREATTHVVQPGETLSGIAALHQVSISSLLALNPGQTPDLLFSGVELIIRGDGTSSTTTTPVEITPPIDAAIDPPSGSTPTADSPQIAASPSPSTSFRPATPSPALPCVSTPPSRP